MKINIIVALFLLFYSTYLMAAPVNYICSYDVWADEEGLHNTKKTMVLNFIVDKSADKYYMLGNNGSVEVHFIQGTNQIGFVEITGTGNVMTTAVNSELKSVHSRNTIMLGELIPQQFYGVCEIR